MVGAHRPLSATGHATASTTPHRPRPHLRSHLIRNAPPTEAPQASPQRAASLGKKRWRRWAGFVELENADEAWGPSGGAPKSRIWRTRTMAHRRLHRPAGPIEAAPATHLESSVDLVTAKFFLISF